MIEEVFMPRWGITMEQGKIVKWLVSVGDFVKAGQPLCEVETEKVVQVVESLVEGEVVEILCPAGTVQKVGEPILLIKKSE